MKSNINKLEFRRRLGELTSKESGIYFFTPYNSSGTPFCGKFDDTSFELTRNSHWRHIKVISIKGEYKEFDKTSTEVIYTVNSSKITRILLFSTIGLFFIVLNVFLLLNQELLDIQTLIESNGWLIILSVFILSYVLGLDWIAKQIVNQRFKQEFGIGIEDEWNRLGGKEFKV